MHVVTVTFEVVLDRVQDFHDALVMQARNALEREQSCLQFDVCVDSDRPTPFFLCEVYDDEEAFRIHLASDHFKAFDASVRPWLRDKRVECWSLLSKSR